MGEETVTRIRLASTFTLLIVCCLLPRSSQAQPWVSEDWQHRIPLWAKSALIEGNETFVDFPLHITLDGPAFLMVFGNAKPDGSDLLVTSGDGITILEREIVGFDPIAQVAEIWVRVPALSKVSNALFLYFDNEGVSLPARPTEAWGTDYRTVYHFAEDPQEGMLLDSSSQAAHIVLDPLRNWTSADVKPGPLHQAWNFNGTTHHLASNAISASDSSFVVSAWIEQARPGVDTVLQCNPGFWEIMSQINDIVRNPGISLSSVSVRWAPSPLPLDGSFHHFAWVFDGVGDQVAFYFDGQAQPVVNVYPASTNPIYRAEFINPARNRPVGVFSPMYFNQEDLHDGGADEFRLRDGVVSAAWIRTEYRNQVDPLNFIEVGAVESSAVTSTAPTIDVMTSVSPNPFRSSTAVRFGLARREHVELTVYDVAGRVVRRLVDQGLEAGDHEFMWGGESSSGNPAAAGVYFLKFVTSRGVETSKVSFIR